MFATLTASLKARKRSWNIEKDSEGNNKHEETNFVSFSSRVLAYACIFSWWRRWYDLCFLLPHRDCKGRKEWGRQKEGNVGMGGKSSCLLNIQAIGERRVCITEVRSKFLSVDQEWDTIGSKSSKHFHLLILLIYCRKRHANQVISGIWYRVFCGSVINLKHWLTQFFFYLFQGNISPNTSLPVCQFSITYIKLSKASFTSWCCYWWQNLFYIIAAS